MNRVKTAPKDGHTRLENVHTQPLRKHRVFNNPEVLPEGWYPICPAKQLPVGSANSFLIGGQRIAVFRTATGKLGALDAFCPHMGADLANGRVQGETLECYFHQWRFACNGDLTATRCGTAPKVQQTAWPVEEKFGFIWVYSGTEAPYPVPSPSGLEEQDVVAFHLGRRRLFAHHHVMMIGGIDLQHFATVHGLDIEFNLEVSQEHPHVATWKLDGAVPDIGWRGRLARWLIGERFNYHARFAGGSIVALTYGPEVFFRGKGRKLPPLHILWGGTPLESGISDVDIFLLAPRTPGVGGGILGWLKIWLTIALLTVLRDDDVKAFPYMRFSVGKWIKEDESAARFVRFIEDLPISRWSRTPPAEER